MDTLDITPDSEGLAAFIRAADPFVAAELIEAAGPRWSGSNGFVQDFPTAYYYLLKDGNLAVPCCRYGHNTAECAVIALAFMLYAVEDSAEWTADYVDSVMGAVVNDSDGLETFNGRGAADGAYVQSAIDKIEALKSAN